MTPKQSRARRWKNRRRIVNEATGRQQDIGAQSIVPLLEIEPGVTLLDLCAAPGNKAAQAIAMGARVFAADRYIGRIGAVPLEAARLVLDATEALPFHKKFDRILIDAPCSGTGTLAHNPEIKWRLKPGDLAEFQIRQRQMIERALPHLAPGGLMVYATCSLEREENEDAVARFSCRQNANEASRPRTRRWILRGRNQLCYSSLMACHQRRAATTAQIASTTPNGHAPCRNP